MRRRACALLLLVAGPGVAGAQGSFYVAPMVLSGSPDLNDNDAGVGVTLAADGRFDLLDEPALSAVLSGRLQVLSQFEQQSFTHLPREAYLEYRQENFDLRVGRQVLLTGVADGFNPTNVFSPQNLRFQTYEDFGDRFGIVSAQVIGYLSDTLTVSALASPFHVSSVLPNREDLGPLSPDAEPLTEMAGSYALRVDHRGQGLDLGLSLYRGLGNTPFLRFDGTEFDYAVPDLTMVGGDVVYVTGPFRGYAEAAYLAYDGDSSFAPRDEFAGIVGLEYEATSEIRLIGQAFHRQIDGAPAIPALPGALVAAAINRASFGQFGHMQTGASFSVRYMAPDGETSGDVTLASWFDDSDYYLRARVKRRVTDNQAVYVRADLYAGDSKTVFGSLSDSSRVALEYRIEF